jgi:site-specific DNA recombinase
MPKSNKRSPFPGETLSAKQPQAVALYARVSTEDQAQNDTVDAQPDFLRNLATVHGWPIAGAYVDEGISGTIPLDKRPDGRRFMTDAEAGRFGTVVSTRMSRLGRKLGVALATYEALDVFGIGKRYPQEGIDTTQPGGEMAFQILGSFAQNAHKTIAEATARGRIRVAAKGQHTGGPIPVGYDLNDQKRLVPSNRLVPTLGCTEAEMIRDIFLRVAAQQTTVHAEIQRLNALGIPRVKRYALSKKRREAGKNPAARENLTCWWDSSLRWVIKNPVYKGEGRSSRLTGT